jgi:hypothetical protein
VPIQDDYFHIGPLANAQNIKQKYNNNPLPKGQKRATMQVTLQLPWLGGIWGEPTVFL